jgi:acyl dehydratase
MTPPSVGSQLPTLRIDRVDPERMKVMALLLHDPNPIHFDPASVTSLGPDPRVINQGPISLGYVVTMLASWLGGDESRITSIDCRYLANVRAEDAVTVGGEVASIEPGDNGTVTARCDVWLEVEGAGRALVGSATVRLPDEG